MPGSDWASCWEGKRICPVMQEVVEVRPYLIHVATGYADMSSRWFAIVSWTWVWRLQFRRWESLRYSADDDVAGLEGQLADDEGREQWHSQAGAVCERPLCASGELVKQPSTGGRIGELDDPVGLGKKWRSERSWTMCPPKKNWLCLCRFVLLGLWFRKMAEYIFKPHPSNI